jgi:hypothetical protein
MAVAAIFMPQLGGSGLRRSWGAEGGEQPLGLRFGLLACLCGFVDTGSVHIAARDGRRGDRINAA